MPELTAIDSALVRLRRLYTGPPRLFDHRGRQVEMSSVLVVEACARHAEEGREPTIGGLAEFVDVAPSTASRLVDRAVEAGFVQRGPSPDDARRSLLRLTPAGEALRAHAVGVRLDWLDRTLGDWTDEDTTRLGALLTRLADAVAVGGPPGRPPER